MCLWRVARAQVRDRKAYALIAPSRSAVGERLLIRNTTLEPQDVEVIGVVEHQRGPSLARDGTPRSSGTEARCSRQLSSPEGQRSRVAE